jgi:PST family polysaccharide transporter
MARPALSRLLVALRHPISRNALALYLVQFALSVLPLVTLPYLTRRLGAHALGLVVFSQSFTWMLQLVIEFGFGASATRAVARRRDDRPALAAAVGAVQGAKLALCSLATLGAAVAAFAVPLFRAHEGYLVLAWITAIAQGLDPTWYFVGVERLQLVSAISVGSRVVATALTILLVHGRGDGWIVLALWAAGTSLTTGAMTALLYRELAPRRPSRDGVRWALGESWRLFVGGTAVTLYTSANAFLLGILSSTSQAAYFSTAEKLVRAAPRAYSPVLTAVYPRVGHLVARGDEARARRLSRMTILVLEALGASIALVLGLFAGPIIRTLYGPAFEPSIGILRVLALLLPILALSGGLANLELLTRQRDRDLVVIVACSAVVNIGLALVLAPAYGAKGMAWGLVVVELVALCGAVVALVALNRRRAALPAGAAEEPARPR